MSNADRLFTAGLVFLAVGLIVGYPLMGFTGIVMIVVGVITGSDDGPRMAG